MSYEENSIPSWAVNLRETVARIDERTKQIPTILNEIDNLRQTTVPMNEHQILMQRVDQLWNRDLQGRPEWEELVPRVKTLWNDRTENIGIRKSQNRAIKFMGVIFGLISAFEVLHSLGIISVPGK